MFPVHSTERPSPEPAPGHLPCAKMYRGHVALMVLEDKMPTPTRGWPAARAECVELGTRTSSPDGVQIHGGKEPDQTLPRKEVFLPPDSPSSLSSPVRFGVHHRFCPLLSSQATSRPQVTTPLRYLHLPTPVRLQLPTPIMKTQTRSCPPCLGPSMVRRCKPFSRMFPCPVPTSMI